MSAIHTSENKNGLGGAHIVRQSLSHLRRTWANHTPASPMCLVEQLESGLTISEFCVAFLLAQRSRRCSNSTTVAAAAATTTTTTTKDDVHGAECTFNATDETQGTEVQTVETASRHEGASLSVNSKGRDREDLDEVGRGVFDDPTSTLSVKARSSRSRRRVRRKKRSDRLVDPIEKRGTGSADVRLDC